MIYKIYTCTIILKHMRPNIEIKKYIIGDGFFIYDKDIIVILKCKNNSIK
ncbi:hypothetical protein [Finch poxvirus]|uniref:Uncharacterized protein n=2 Tax=unclassified Avipoxvirus TaxID=336487 RepID=A0AAT9UR17_9POXV|nr:hypothetical protein [Finch poxvirus]UOX38959.1 hypothetical protein [Finch poxvirus]